MNTEIKEKMEKAKYWAKRKAFEAKLWCIENKQFLLTVGVPVAISAGIRLSKNHTKKQEIKADTDHRDLDIYDRSLGIYYRMNRKPSPAEYGEITRRKSNGENYYDILNSMGLL